MFAAKNPRLYAAALEAKQVAQEAGQAGVAAAATGAVMAGAISALKNGLAVSQGKMSAGEAITNTAADAARAGARSGATGAARGGDPVRGTKGRNPGAYQIQRGDGRGRRVD